MPPTKDNGELKIKSRQGAEDHFNYKQQRKHCSGRSQPLPNMPGGCVNLLVVLCVSVFGGPLVVSCRGRVLYRVNEEAAMEHRPFEYFVRIDLGL